MKGFILKSYGETIAVIYDAPISEFYFLLFTAIREHYYLPLLSPIKLLGTNVDQMGMEIEIEAQDTNGEAWTRLFELEKVVIYQPQNNQL
jgi:hypothetical protein